MKKKVVKALLFYDNQLLLLERSGKLFHGMEDLPGGKLEADELPIPGLIREIKEETQLNVNQLLHVATHEWEGPDGTQYLEYLYCALVDTNTVIPNPDEHSTFRWVELEQIESSKIHPKIKELILANMSRIEALLFDNKK
jgi:ADP-ribose pyrophosphatase YjhB (NUDIX family)